MSQDEPNEFRVKRPKTASIQKPQNTATSHNLGTPPKERTIQRKNRRNRGIYYAFCKKKLEKFNLWETRGSTLEEARQTTTHTLLQLLNKDSDCRDYAIEISRDQLPVEALFYCLTLKDFTSTELDRLMANGPVAWVCFKEIIKCFPQLKTAENIHAILRHIKYIQPILTACLLFPNPNLREGSTSNNLDTETFFCMLQAGADAPNVALCYHALKRQNIFFPVSSFLLNSASSLLPVPIQSEKQETQNTENIKAWLILFVALPGLASAYQSICRCNEFSASEKSAFIRQAIELGTNIQAISNAVKTLGWCNSLNSAKLEQLFALITKRGVKQTFIPETLAADIALATADSKKLPDLQERLAGTQYVSPNFVAAECLSNIYMGAYLAKILDKNVLDTLLLKAQSLTPVISEALRFLADQPAGKYAPGCRRILNKPILNQALNLITVPEGKSAKAPDNWQINAKIVELISIAMGNKKDFSALKFKKYPALHALQQYNMEFFIAEKEKVSIPEKEKSNINCTSSFFPSSSSSSQHPAPYSYPPHNALASSLHTSQNSTSLPSLKAGEPQKVLAARREKLSIIVQQPDAQLTRTRALLEKAWRNAASRQHRDIEGYEVELIKFYKPDYTLSEEDREQLTKIEKSVQKLITEQEKAVDTPRLSS